MSESVLPVRIFRYDIKKLRFGQVLVPIATIATVAARRLPGVVSAGVAGLSLCLALIAFVTARRGFGQRMLTREGRRLRFGDESLEIRPADVTVWTWDARTARLYGAEVSWRLTTDRAHADGIRAALTSAFGPPKVLHRRGSARARGLAIAVGIAGVAMTATGIALQITVFAVGGILAFIAGAATFGALSQKVTGAR